MNVLGEDHDDSCEMYSEACGCKSRADLRKEIDRAILAEREECARICDGLEEAYKAGREAAIQECAIVCEDLDDGLIGGWYECASAIRALRNSK